MHAIHNDNSVKATQFYVDIERNSSEREDGKKFNFLMKKKKNDMPTS